VFVIFGVIDFEYGYDFVEVVVDVDIMFCYLIVDELMLWECLVVWGWLFEVVDEVVIMMGGLVDVFFVIIVIDIMGCDFVVLVCDVVMLVTVVFSIFGV